MPMGAWIAVAGVAGLAVGAIFAWLMAERRSTVQLAAVRDERSEATAEAARAQAQLDARLEAAGKAIAERDEGLRDARDQVERLRVSLGQQQVHSERLTTQLEAERQNVADQRRLLAEAEAKFKDVFAGVGGEALDKNSKAFLDLAKQRFETLSETATGELAKRQEQISTLVQPMTVLLQKYEERLKDVEKARGDDKQQLASLLTSLRDSHQRLDTQTSQLVTALSKTNTRGRWGEIALERIVELAGMTRHVDFEPQVTVNGVEGQQRPDMVIRLPDNRRIILDSKVPWEGFQAGAAETDAAKREACFKDYGRAVQRHCRALSSRNYQDQFKGTLEFVVMFMPGEAFLYAAVEQFPALIEDALKDKVVIATPTTLIALLKAIEFGWRQQRTADNAAEIQELGKELHRRIGTFVEHFCKLGKGLNTAADAYNEAMGSMERMLLTTTAKFEEHGVSSGKEIRLPDGIDSRIANIGERATASIARAGLIDAPNEVCDANGATDVDALLPRNR